MTAATRDEVPVALGGEGVEVRNMPIGGGMSISELVEFSPDASR
ncbi:hypothetical protein [Streptomyces tibetensis]